MRPFAVSGGGIVTAHKHLPALMPFPASGGGYWDDDMAREWAEYQKCFYDARNLKKDVLKRKYRPLREILRRVRDWAAARKTRRADWNPIGAPRSHTRAKIAAALSL